MTIALGFKCSDGIVLATDSQMTKEGGLKFNDKKIFCITGGEWMVAMAFAGSADLMKPIHDEMDWRLDELEDDGPPITAAVFQYLEEIAEQYAKKHKDKTLELLCAASDSRYGKSLFSVRGKLVTITDRECIGVGDSSVVRYLAGIFNQADLDARQCLLLSSYMVHQATKYIDGCGGPIQAAITMEGRVSVLDDVVNQVDHDKVESALRWFLPFISSGQGTEVANERALTQFWKSIQGFDWTNSLRF